jgi:S1-C subfamily serine protease
MTLLKQISQDLSNIVAEAGKAVVAVHGNRYSASGIHWQPELIVTSYESVNLDDKIYVTLPQGEKIEVSVLGSDPTTDIVVLQMPSGNELSLPRIAESSTGRKHCFRHRSISRIRNLCQFWNCPDPWCAVA